MSTDRRTFLRLAAATGALALTPRGLLSGLTPRRSGLRILILGGTGFIGPYQVQYALDRGHKVTLFNRGQTNPGLFPTVEKLIGDRSSDLSALEGRTWDVVIDNARSNPDWVERSAKLLAKQADRYVFVSTRSVYKDTSRVPMTIDAELFTPENTPIKPGQPLPYGLAKVMSEREAERFFPGRTLVVRPSLIVGPGDLTDRFTYWPVRLQRGGEVLAPGDGTDSVQIIDVRDLCEWTIRLCEKKVAGIFNALGPAEPYSFASFLDQIKAATGSNATLTWVDTDFLTAHDVRGYREMPVWMPAKGGHEGFGRFDISREVALGLTFRSLAVTTKDTLEYYHSQPAERQETLKAGISPEREAEVLAAWHARRG